MLHLAQEELEIRSSLPLTSAFITEHPEQQKYSSQTSLPEVQHYLE